MRIILFFILYIPFFSLSAATNTSIDDAISLRERGEYKSAITVFTKLANSGDAVAQRNLGEMIFLEQGVKSDAHAAFVWTELAAKNDDPIGQYNLGYLFEHGIGAERSIDKAVAWYRQSGNQGYPLAMRRLGEIYKDSNHSLSLYWYDQARRAGDRTVLDQVRALSYEAREQSDKAEAQSQRAKIAELERNRRQAAERNAGPSFGELLTKELGQLSQQIGVQSARIDAASRGTSVEEENRRALESARYQAIVAESRAVRAPVVDTLPTPATPPKRASATDSSTMTELVLTGTSTNEPTALPRAPAKDMSALDPGSGIPKVELVRTKKEHDDKQRQFCEKELAQGHHPCGCTKYGGGKMHTCDK